MKALLMLLALAHPSAPYAGDHAGSATQSANLTEIVSAIQESPAVESFYVTCTHVITREKSVAWYDSVPKIGFCPVVRQGPAVAAQPRTELARLVEHAAQDTCRIELGCLFDGRYAFRFHDRQPPLDLVISPDCTSWIFYRGDKAITSEAGLSGYAACIRSSLRRVLAKVFTDMDRSFKYDWPLLMYR